MLSWGDELPDEAFWDRKLAAAVELRPHLLRLDEVTDSYRVVHAEADGLPGLVIDKLGDVLSAECFSVGMYQRAQAIVRRLAQLGDPSLDDSPQSGSESQEGFDGPVLSSPETSRTRDDSGVRHAVSRRLCRRPQDRLLLRPARQPPDAGRLLPGQDRTRPGR